MESNVVIPEKRDDKSKLITSYKTVLKDIVDQRPSGLRRRLAQTLGKHKSFISQITNPSYRVPIPARDLQTIFDVCTFSTKERKIFLKFYNQAHATHIDLNGPSDRVMMDVVISLPAFENPVLARETEKLIRDFSARVIELARMKDKGDR